MSNFQSKRIVREHSETISAPASKVFPLLCPVRERDWLDGWESEMVYSESGVAEDNCIFKAHFSGRGEGLYVVSRYDPGSYAIEFTTFWSTGLVMKMDIHLEDDGNRGSIARFRHTFTGLTEEGNRFVDEYSGSKYREMMSFLGQSLDHYCSTGTMFKKPSLLKGLHSLLGKR